MKKQNWLHEAYSDDKIVANLLLHLKRHSSSFFLPPSWGLRQPRSKPLSLSSSSPSKYTRRSPTTPLSWTGGSGGCGGGSTSYGGCEESSSVNIHLPPPPDWRKSKISVASDTPTTSSKRSRKKKTFVQLKEEESSLMKEQTYLKKELVTLRVKLSEQRSINENLKRIKLDLQANYDPDEQNTSLTGSFEAASSNLPRLVKTEDAQTGASSQEPVFALPDLNMALDEECDTVWMS